MINPFKIYLPGQLYSQITLQRQLWEQWNSQMSKSSPSQLARRKQSMLRLLRLTDNSLIWVNWVPSKYSILFEFSFFLNPTHTPSTACKKSILNIQGDLSRCAKTPVKFKTKVPLWPGQARQFVRIKNYSRQYP